MSRLTEALERARNAGVTVPVGTTTAPAPTPDVPSDWTFTPEGAAPPFDAAAVAAAPVTTLEGFSAALASAGAIDGASAAVTSAAAPGVAPAPAPVVRPEDGVGPKLVMRGQTDTLLVEQYRRLAAVLHHAQTERQIRTVMVASAVPAEGKTLTTTNLALTLSQSYEKKVLVIDADLRRPSLHGMFGVSGAEGLTTALGDTAVERLPVKQISGGFWLLPAGKPNPNPMSLLTSDAMKQLLADAAAQFDWVILDTPPVGLMADANLLAAMVDAALIVVKAGSTPYPLVQKAVAAMGPGRVLGVVLNRASRDAASHEYDYYGYYENVKPAKKGRFRFR